MNKLLTKLIFTFLIIKLSLAFEYRQLVYTNLNCEGDPKFIYSSTQCSPNGYISIKNRTFVSVGPTTEELCRKSSSSSSPVTLTTEPSNLLKLDTCIKSSNGINSYVYLVNEKSSPIMINGYCNTFSYFNNQNCNNILVYSYQNGSCVYSSKLSQYRKLVCTQTDQLTFDCGTDSSCSKCTLSPANSGVIPNNKCSIKEIHITDSPNSSSKLSSISFLLLSFILVLFYI